MNKLTKEEIQTTWGLTVGKLKKFLEDHKIPDTAKVLIQRVEDSYYEGSDISGFTGTLPDGTFGPLPPGSKAEGWGVYLKKGDQCGWIMDMNELMEEEIARREKGEEPEHPDIEDPKKYIAEITDEDMDQYSPAWCCVFYKDDPDLLFIDLHY
jgi:hypothetical protein